MQCVELLLVLNRVHRLPESLVPIGEEILRLSDVQRLESLLADLGAVSRDLRRISGELADSTSGLAVTVGRADSALARVNRIAARVESGEGVLGRLLSDSTLALRTEAVLAQLDSLLADLRENPRRYVRLSIF